MADMFSNRTLLRQDTVMKPSLTPKLPPTPAPIGEDQLRIHVSPVDWTAVADTMNAGPTYQPQYQNPKLKELSGLNRNLALRIVHGRELAMQAVKQDEAGRLSQAKKLYMEALSFLVPTSRDLSDGIASNRKLRMQQKAKVKQEATVLMDRCEKIRDILKVNAVNPPRAMPSMPSIPKSVSPTQLTTAGNRNPKQNQNRAPIVSRPQCLKLAQTANSAQNVNRVQITNTSKHRADVRPSPQVVLDGSENTLALRVENRMGVLPAIATGASTGHRPVDTAFHYQTKPGLVLCTPLEAPTVPGHALRSSVDEKTRLSHSAQGMSVSINNKKNLYPTPTVFHPTSENRADSCRFQTPRAPDISSAPVHHKPAFHTSKFSGYAAKPQTPNVPRIGSFGSSTTNTSTSLSRNASNSSTPAGDIRPLSSTHLPLTDDSVSQHPSASLTLRNRLASSGTLLSDDETTGSTGMPKRQTCKTVGAAATDARANVITGREQAQVPQVKNKIQMKHPTTPTTPLTAVPPAREDLKGCYQSQDASAVQESATNGHISTERCMSVQYMNPTEGQRDRLTSELKLLEASVSNLSLEEFIGPLPPISESTPDDPMGTPTMSLPLTGCLSPRERVPCGGGLDEFEPFEDEHSEQTSADKVFAVRERVVGVGRCVICTKMAGWRAPCGHDFCKKCAIGSVAVFNICPMRHCYQELSVDTFRDIV